MGRAVRGPNGPGAVPESGVNNGDVVSLSCGENVDEDAVSVYALWRDVVLCE